MRLLVSLTLIMIALVRRPDHAACPVKWHVSRAGADGSFACAPNPPRELPTDGCWGGRPCSSEIVDQSEVASQLYCTNGMIAIQDGTSAWCARVP